MQTIRKPSLIEWDDIPLYIVGSAYSNEQAWVEGAFCAASVLEDFCHLDPLIDTSYCPLIRGG